MPASERDVERESGAEAPVPGGSLRQELYAMYAMWLREFKVFQREKSRVVSSMATPLIWILIIGSGFGATTEFRAEALRDMDYRTFMFPGIIAMAILFQTVFFGLYIVWDRKIDVLKEVLVAPVSRVTIFFGKVLGGATESFIQGIILFIVGVLFFGSSLVDVLQAAPFVIALAIAFVSVGLFIGSFFESLEGFQVVVTFLVFPLFFLSGALFPVEGLPPWLEVATRINPVTYAVDGLRLSLLGFGTFPYWLNLGVISGFAVLTVAAGTWAFARMK